jgi:hypothetical protein
MVGMVVAMGKDVAIMLPVIYLICTARQHFRTLLLPTIHS